MRQAGRYLPEYKATRAARAILCRCAKTPSWRAVTLQPLRRYPLDAAILSISSPCRTRWVKALLKPEKVRVLPRQSPAKPTSINCQFRTRKMNWVT
ncbi:uroporphyrinogen decarboxylase family protein [Escherichia coli]